MMQLLSMENLCNECPPSIRGLCCYIMTRVDSHQFTLTKHPCKYLNPKTGRCKIYKKRKKINPNCLSLEEMYLQGGLPKNCPYVKENPEYQNRTNIRDAISIPPEHKDAYNELNNSLHREISVYDTIRDPLCIKCKSQDIIEEWNDKFSILFFRYECVQCGHKWNTFKNQIKFTLKLISRKKKGMEEI